MERTANNTHFGVEDLKRYCDSIINNFSNIREIMKEEFEKEEVIDEAIVEQPEKEEVKTNNTVDVIIVEPTKTDNTGVVIDVEPTKVEPLKKEEVKTDDSITMTDRKTCPVEVVPTKSNRASINVKNNDTAKEVDESLNGFIIDLNSRGVTLNSVKRTSTGLVEVQLLQKTGNIVTISVDIDNKLYNMGYIVFFFGKVEPLTEYDNNNRPIIFNDNTLQAIINNAQIEYKYYVPENIVLLNRFVDMTTLKETNKKKREKVLIKTSKALELMNDDIVNAAANEPYRFAFARYTSVNKFSLVSSKRNLVSNLSKDKLKTSKEIWLNVDNDTINLSTKTK